MKIGRIAVDRPLSPGDVAELEVGGVGVQRSSIGQPQPASGWPTRRQPFM